MIPSYTFQRGLSTAQQTAVVSNLPPTCANVHKPWNVEASLKSIPCTGTIKYTTVVLCIANITKKTKYLVIYILHVCHVHIYCSVNNKCTRTTTQSWDACESHYHLRWKTRLQSPPEQRFLRAASTARDRSLSPRHTPPQKNTKRQNTKRRPTIPSSHYDSRNVTTDCTGST